MFVLKRWCDDRSFLDKKMTSCIMVPQTDRGDKGGLNSSLPVPFNPGCPLFVLAPAFSIVKHCTMLCNFPLSHLPLPWESCFPSPLLPPPFVPGFRPPVPLPQTLGSGHKYIKHHDFVPSYFSPSTVEMVLRARRTLNVLIPDKL